MSYEALCEAAARLDIDEYNRLKRTCSPLKGQGAGDGVYETPLKYLPKFPGVDDMEKASAMIKLIKAHIIDAIQELAASRSSASGMPSLSFAPGGTVIFKDKVSERELESGLQNGTVSLAKDGENIRSLGHKLPEREEWVDNILIDKDDLSLPPLFFCMNHAESDPFECIKRNARVLFNMGYRNVCFEYDKSAVIDRVILDLELTVRCGDGENKAIALNNLEFLQWLKLSKFSYLGMDADLGSLRGREELLIMLDKSGALSSQREKVMADVISRSIKHTKGGTIIIMGASHIKVASNILEKISINGAQALCLTSQEDLYALFLSFHANSSFNVGISAKLIRAGDSAEERHAKQDNCLWEAICKFGLWRSTRDFDHYTYSNLDPKKKGEYRERTQQVVLESGPVMGMWAICPFDVTFALSKDYKVHAQIKASSLKDLLKILNWVEIRLRGYSFALEKQDRELLLTIYGINDPKLAVQDQIKLNYFDLVLKGRNRMVPVDEYSAPTPLLYGRKIFGSSADKVWAKRTEEFQLDLHIGHEEGMTIEDARALQKDLQSKYNFPVKPRVEMLTSAVGDRANVILPCANSRNSETLYQAVKSSSRQLNLRKRA